MSKKFIDLRPTLKEFNNDPEIMALEKELAEREERVRFGRAFLKARKMVGVLPSETARQDQDRRGGGRAAKRRGGTTRTLQPARPGRAAARLAEAHGYLRPCRKTGAGGA